MFFISFIFMLPMFLLSCMFTFELAGLIAGLGDAVTIVFELALLFEFSVVHAAPKTARANNARITVVRLMSLPPGCSTSQIVWGNLMLIEPLTYSLEALDCSLNRGNLDRPSDHLTGHFYFLPGKFSRLFLTRFVEFVNSLVVLVGQDKLAAALHTHERA